jgi:hypothetical protein
LAGTQRARLARRHRSAPSARTPPPFPIGRGKKTNPRGRPRPAGRPALQRPSGPQPTMKPGRKPLPPVERRQRRQIATRKAAIKWWRKEGSERRARRNSKRRRAPATFEGYRVCEASNLDRPLLRYMDANGRIHTERELSAEQLIERFLLSKKKGSHAPTPARAKHHVFPHICPRINKESRIQT